MKTTCGTAQNCDLNGCAGTFDSQSNTARCRGKFAGCVCNPVAVSKHISFCVKILRCSVMAMYISVFTFVFVNVCHLIRTPF